MIKLNELAVKDERLFSRYLDLAEHQLSVYSFANIYIWKKLFDIRWVIIEESLCVIFRDKIGAFLYLPPLAEKNNPGVAREIFRILDSFNGNKEISRIENVEAVGLGFYRGLGYNYQQKSCDYLCLRNDLAGLRGNKFKSKRAPYNYFLKHYQFEYLPYSCRFKSYCFKLYEQWMQDRLAHNQDDFYRWMMEDSRNSLKIALDNYAKLNLSGCIVRVGNEIKAFSFGFRLNKNTFCILYEITDLSIKGLAQFIFAEFCNRLKDYKYINIMDDSGLENLKKVKLSFSPLRLIPAFNIFRRNE